jgi:predicted pyridoxine 5'-phosphate oxidase superfamily flavin-nucleotide-binding protein
MGILTDDMQRVVREQRLGYVATVCPDGTPNLSPKGTTRVWDGDHLVFADLRSPGTIANLRHNPITEINVVDPTTRKGYRFKGTAAVLSDGPLFEQIRATYGTGRDGDQHDLTQRIRAVVLVRVTQAAALVSPAYDTGLTEAEIVSQWDAYWQSLREHRGTAGSRLRV